MNKKKGFIVLTNELVMSEWDTIHKMFKTFIPTHIEYRHWKDDTWVYYGISNQFKELSEGEAVPQYHFHIIGDTVKWDKNPIFCKNKT